MKKRRVLGYLALVAVPIAAGCSVGTDNNVIYYMSGELRNEFVQTLTQNYWTNFVEDVSNPTNNQQKVYRALLKEDGVGVNLTEIKIMKLVKANGTELIVSKGTGTDIDTQVLYNCQGEQPEGLTDEEKKTMASPNPTKCDENNTTISPEINGSTEFHISVSYTGGKLARDTDVPKGEVVKFCAIATYDKINGNIAANIDRLVDGDCTTSV